MYLNDIITLVKAGYTKDEISAMQVSPTEPAAGPAEVTPDPQPVPEENAPAPAPAPAQEPGNYEKMEALLNKLINITQGQNINTNMAGAAPARTSQDILADVIAPPVRKKGA